MYEKLRFSMNGFMHFLMWSMFNFNVTCAVYNGGKVDPYCVSGVLCDYYCNPGFAKTCDKLAPCPARFNRGYIEPSCIRLPGNSCTFYCNPGLVKKGNRLTCGNDEMWIQDKNSTCIKSDEETSSYSGQANVGVIVGITMPFLIMMIIIVYIVVWKAKRSSVRKSQRVPGHAGDSCLRPRENRDQNVTTLRQQPNADVINSVLSFESPSYNGIYFNSFDQRISTISSSYRYPEPPPSYSETQIATNHAPPTYIEVVTEPTRFNVYI